MSEGDLNNDYLKEIQAAEENMMMSKEEIQEKMNDMLSDKIDEEYKKVEAEFKINQDKRDLNNDYLDKLNIAEQKIKEEAEKKLQKIMNDTVLNNIDKEYKKVEAEFKGNQKEEPSQDTKEEKEEELLEETEKEKEEEPVEETEEEKKEKAITIRVPTNPLQGLETDSKGRLKMKVDSNIYVEELEEEPPVEIDLCDLDRPIKGQRKCCISFASPPITNIEKRENFIMNEYLKLFLSQYTEIVLKHVSADFELNKDDVLEKYGFMKRVTDSLENFSDKKWKETKESHEQIITNNFFTANINDMLVMYNQFRRDNMAELRQSLEEKYPRECFEYAVKIRGNYSTSAKANRRSDDLMKKDKHNKIYVADVGAWLPVCPPDSCIGRQKTIDKQLNKLMWSHRKNILYADRFFKERINEQVEDKIRKTLHTSVPPDPLATADDVENDTSPGGLMSKLSKQQNINRKNKRRVRKRRGKRN